MVWISELVSVNKTSLTKYNKYYSKPGLFLKCTGSQKILSFRINRVGLVIVHILLIFYRVLFI